MNVLLKNSAFTSTLGILAAMLAVEAGLRPLASVIPDPYIHRGEFRQHKEGFSVAHYSPAGERLTGNAVLPDARTLLLIGDSHVEADQVDDAATMGAVLERTARAAGDPVNVRQFGLSGADAGSLVRAAPAMQARVQPHFVVVLLHASNLGFASSRHPLQWKQHPDPQVDFFAGDQRPPASLATRLRRTICARSVLASELYVSFANVRYSVLTQLVEVRQRLLGLPSASFPSGAARIVDPRVLPLALTLGLKQFRAAYGDRLLIVYDIFLIELSGDPVDPVETPFLQACKTEGVACVSTGPRLLADRQQHARFSRGFSNTIPGFGHFNEAGHEVVANVVWDALRELPAGRR